MKTTEHIKQDYTSRRYYPKVASAVTGKGQRSSFGIYIRYVYTAAPSKNVTHYCTELEAINSQFQKKVIDFEIAKKNTNALVRKLNRELGVLNDIDVFNHDNEKILKDYWEKEYDHRDLVDPRAAHNALTRAVRVLANTSLLTATRQELQKQINQNVAGNNQRSTIERISKLLKHIGRTDIKLVKSKPVHEPVKYLTWKEFDSLLMHINHEPLKILAQVAFYTGMREGEALAGQENIFRIDDEAPQIYVQCQLRAERLRMDGTLTEGGISVPKSKKRIAYIFSEGLPAIKEWVKISKRFELTRTRASKLLTEACKKAFPNNPEKWMAFNGLRHSYAKSLFEIGANMGYVAKCLGNTEKVCQEYYSGWEHTPNSITLLHTLVQQNKHKLK